MSLWFVHPRNEGLTLSCPLVSCRLTACSNSCTSCTVWFNPAAIFSLCSIFSWERNGSKFTYCLLVFRNKKTNKKFYFNAIVLIHVTHSTIIKPRMEFGICVYQCLLVWTLPSKGLINWNSKWCMVRNLSRRLLTSSVVRLLFWIRLLCPASFKISSWIISRDCCACQDTQTSQYNIKVNIHKRASLTEHYTLPCRDLLPLWVARFPPPPASPESQSAVFSATTENQPTVNI